MLAEHAAILARHRARREGRKRRRGRAELRAKGCVGVSVALNEAHLNAWKAAPGRFRAACQPAAGAATTVPGLRPFRHPGSAC